MSYRRRRPPNPLLFLTLTLTLLFAFSSSAAAAAAAAGAGNLTAPCLRDQLSSLLRLKESFFAGGNLTSWVPGTDCCAWDGVTCDPASGRVTALDLSDRSIAGELDFSALFNLTSLRSLNLAYNLFDQIPLPQPGFETLANLTHLNLSNSGFVGQVPAGISRLSSLVSLDLSTFYLNEQPSYSLYLRNPTFRTLIANLSNLQFLYLDGVEIAADGPEWCGAMAASAPGLRELSLSGCSLAGPVDPSLSHLRWLSKLRLDQNNLSSALPEFFANFSSLSVLQLSSCGLEGVFPGGILQLRNLTVLDVSDNPSLSGRLPDFPEDCVLESLVLSGTNFSGKLPDSIGNLKPLTSLELTGCGFSGSIPSAIANLTQLVHLDLSLNNFSGRIPSFVQWPKISEIILAHNSLSGSIPPSDDYAALRKLTKIDLRNNSLTGPIPDSLFAGPSLQLLQLSQNKLSGTLTGFSNASPSLATIDLSDNKLQGMIPNSVSQLSGLSVLSLGSNNFSGAFDLDIIQNMRNLSNLDLSNNMLIIVDGEDNSSFHSFPKISTLKLVSCNLTKIPTFLRYQDIVSNLDLSNNKISGAIPNWIWSIGNESWAYLNLSYNMFTSIEGPLTNLSSIPLMTLDIHSNMLQGSLPLPPLNINILDYSKNNFSSSIPFNFPSYITFAIFFSVSNNNLIGEIPASFCNASYLQVLDLSNNGLSGSIPSCLLKGSGIDLRILNLGANQLTGTLPQDVGKGCELRTINLSSNKLEGKLPQSLANCQMLEVLDIGNNQIVDSFPYWLGELYELRVLVLRSNGFYGPVGHPTSSKGSNSTFPMLQIFDVSSNGFNGTLPSDCFADLKAMKVGSDDNQFTVGYSYLKYTESYYENSVTVTFKGLDITLVKILTIFTSLDLSNNGFEGGIPESVGELKLLHLLNISHNSLSGEIPSQIGDLSQLESLDLSSNNLSGEIPQMLTLLTFLSYLNLSYNNLVGRIPQDLQFRTFSNFSFLGDQGLCGPPLTKQCSSSSSVSEQASNSNSNSKSIELNWQFISVGIGYGGGLAIVVGPLMVWSKGKRWYNMYVDRMLLAILPLWLCEACGDGRVGIEEGDDDEESMEEEEENRKFCVFCTGLEIDEERVVMYHVECSCPKLLLDDGS